MENNFWVKDYCQKNPQFKQIFRIMRITVVLFMVCTFCSYAAKSHSQNARVSINKSDVYLEEILNEIESQTDYLFIYNDQVDISRKQSVKVKSKPVYQVLDELFKENRIGYEFEGTHILLTNRPIKETTQDTRQEVAKLTGIVLDDKGEPVIGASVAQKGSTNGTITDWEGKFSLRVDLNSVLLVSFVGYTPKEIPVKNQNPLTITLSEDKIALEEIVVIGYGTAKRKDITGSVSSVSSEKLKATPAVSLNQVLQGKTAGVQVVLGDNAPGGGVSVNIRGVGSITQANDPIYVVDGIIMEGTLNNINVNDIASIDVLKDASAAAIYGSRAANGVVIVTTKRGQEGKSNISFSLRTSVQKADNLPQMLTAQELAGVRVEGNVNSQLDDWYRENPRLSLSDYQSRFNELKSSYLQEYPLSMFTKEERQTLLKGDSYDWYKETARTGLIQDYTVAFSGATDKSNYYISTNYYNHKGLIIGSDYRRLSFRVNLEQQIKSWLKLGVNSNFMDSKRESIGESVTTGLGMNPMYPFFVDDKRPLTVPFYTSAGQNNPVLSQEISNDATSRQYSLNAYLIVNFTKDLFLKSNIVIDARNNFQGYFAPSTIKEGESTKGIAQIGNESWMDFMQENTLNYAKVFGMEHRVNVLVGNTIQTNRFRGNQQYATNFATNALGYNNIGAASEFSPGSQSSNTKRWQISSFIGRLNYSFHDKYILTATGRFDGNSKYGKNNKWGFFPSVAGAWRISGEEFMGNIPLLNDLKLRVSWGEMGNSNIDPYSSFTKLTPGITVGPDGKPVNTIQNSDQIMGNPDLRWERQQQFNVGLDFTAFNNRLRFMLDAYKKKSKDLVLKTPLPITTGYSLAYSNVGELQNKGVEISVGGRIIDALVKWDVDVNWTVNRNKLTKLYGGLTERLNDPNSPTSAGWWVGQPLGTIYTYRYDGIWQWNDDRELMDIMKDGEIGGDTYYPGENKIADLDGDNKITTADREIVGYTDPKWYGGLSTTVSYKNFSLDLNFNYVYGNKIFNRSYHEYTLGAGYGFMNLTSDVFDRWAPDNQLGEIPRAHANNLDRMLISSRLMQDGSYLRLKTATLRYNFPEKLLKAIYLSHLSVYVSGDNLWTWTGYKGMNPESPGSWSESYPCAKAVTFGLNVNF